MVITAYGFFPLLISGFLIFAAFKKAPFLDGKEDRPNFLQLRARVPHAQAHPGCAQPDCTTAAQLPCASRRLCPLLADLLSGLQGREPSCQSSAAAAAIGLKQNQHTKKTPNKTKGKDDM